MPVFESDIFGADTVAAGTLSEAFIGGEGAAHISSGIEDAAAEAVRNALWSDDPVNRILIVISTISLLLVLPTIIRLFPLLWGGIFRLKPASRIFENVHLSRDRNLLALLCIVPFCIAVAKLKLYRLEIMDSMSEGMASLLIIGVFFTWMLARLIFDTAIAPRNISDGWKLSESIPLNFFIITTICLLVPAFAETILNLSENTLQTASYLIIGLLYLLMLLRRLEILSRKYHLFKAFLYLCGLEGLPSGLLITSTLIY